jgi:hypothetical protein
MSVTGSIAERGHLGPGRPRSDPIITKPRFSGRRAVADTVTGSDDPML